MYRQRPVFGMFRMVEEYRIRLRQTGMTTSEAATASCTRGGMSWMVGAHGMLISRVSAPWARPAAAIRSASCGSPAVSVRTSSRSPAVPRRTADRDVGDLG